MINSKEVIKVGNIEIGNKNSIIIQSMTVSDTLDVDKCTKEIVELYNVGCEIVRVTTPSIREAEKIKTIKENLKKKNIFIPIVADVHFTPNAAIVAAKYADKVRINPGNYTDKKKAGQKNYSEQQYQTEIEKAEKKLIPLLEILKKQNKPLRIGVNHGSLSDRITNKYGDTPIGMVQSAIEFVDLCRKHNYYDIVISMKSSNVIVMIEAYRLLFATMKQKGYNYPLHLGVTEAGDGDDARIKSAIGISTLLLDKIGDTIRVSLTEDSVNEIDVCKSIIKNIKQQNKNFISIQKTPKKNKKTSILVSSKNSFFDKTLLDNNDYIYIKNNTRLYDCNTIIDKENWNNKLEKNKNVLLKIEDIKEVDNKLKQAFFVNFLTFKNVEKLKNLNTKSIIVLETDDSFKYHEIRKYIAELLKKDIKNKVILKLNLSNEDDIIINSSIFFGGLILDNFIDGICIDNNSNKTNNIIKVLLSILQATRKRTTKTEYISCPSCGRTLFNLQETTKKIKDKTDHLKKIKIAVMGCIVNGPGEMADADFGYVGSGIKKVSLYKGKKMIKKNIPEEDAVDELIKLIKENNMWIEK